MFIKSIIIILGKPSSICFTYFCTFQDPNRFWDFLSLRPESTHMTLFLFSDKGIPDGFRFMDGFAVHTFKLVNAKGEAFWCKFHFKVISSSFFSFCSQIVLLRDQSRSPCKCIEILFFNENFCASQVTICTYSAYIVNGLLNMNLLCRGANKTMST